MAKLPSHLDGATIVWCIRVLCPYCDGQEPIWDPTPLKRWARWCHYRCDSPAPFLKRPSGLQVRRCAAEEIWEALEGQDVVPPPAAEAPRCDPE